MQGETDKAQTEPGPAASPSTVTIRQIATITGTFKDALVSWLGSASNGIGQFFADVGNFGRFNTTELCMKDANGETCLMPFAS